MGFAGHKQHTEPVTNTCNDLHGIVVLVCQLSGDRGGAEFEDGFATMGQRECDLLFFVRLCIDGGE